MNKNIFAVLVNYCFLFKVQKSFKPFIQLLLREISSANFDVLQIFKIFQNRWVGVSRYFFSWENIRYFRRCKNPFIHEESFKTQILMTTPAANLKNPKFRKKIVYKNFIVMTSVNPIKSHFNLPRPILTKVSERWKTAWI